MALKLAKYNTMKIEDSQSVGTDTGDSITTQDLQKPILVGYAFGPKKMNTMATVMAEASRARVVAVVSVDESEAFERHSHSLTTAALHIHQEKESQHPKSVLLSHGGLDNIVRCFRSSCSSVGSDDEIGSTTSTTGTGTITTRRTFSSHASATSMYPVRVSFVPVDLDEPLEDQHGGRFDIILHKMTEDILCLSNAPSSWKKLLDERGDISDKTQSCRPMLAHAIQRIHRLLEYQRSFPQCSLTDDPVNVEIVMSRSAISATLQVALMGVSSTSGLVVATPNFVDYSQFNQVHSLCYPLIAKPLTAAGTTKSHCMAIVLNPGGLSKIEVPCLLQEYANHSATLFKVYVLGDDVFVFSRSSLPDLPCEPGELDALKSYVEFDSQRPYPTIDDFGLEKPVSSSLSDQVEGLELSATEVAPIVRALKQAFGLELFGFDILVSHNRLLVVDVNYFPSFKEVSNFPSLLAKFLVERAVHKRKGSSSPQETCIDDSY